MKAWATSVVTSLRWRIIGWIVVVVFAALASVIYVSDSVERARIHDDANGHVTQEVQEFQKFAAEAPDPATGELFDNPTRLVRGYLSTQMPRSDEFLFGVVKGRFIAQDLNSTRTSERAHSLSASDPIVQEIIASSNTTGIYELSDGSDVHWGKVALAMEGSDRVDHIAILVFTEEELAEHHANSNTLIIIGLLALLAAALVAWGISHRIIRPVRQVDDVAKSIAESNDLSTRVPVHGSDEIAQLATTFNTMLDRIDLAQRTQRQFVDDAGHELRTPITVIRGNLELLDKASPQERERSIALCMTELDRMTRMVNDMLTLAVMDSNSAKLVDLQDTDITELTIEIEDKAFVLSDGRTVVTNFADATTAVDAHRITEAVLELVRNALKYATPDTTIEIESTTDQDNVYFSVSNVGAGISEEQMETLFQRFHRGDLTHQHGTTKMGKGAGLGLAIVQAIAQAHDGGVEVTSVEHGTTTFTISIPLTHHNE